MKSIFVSGIGGFGFLVKYATENSKALTNTKPRETKKLSKSKMIKYDTCCKPYYSCIIIIFTYIQYYFLLFIIYNKGSISSE